jgi:cytolysin-activating lysine-acyltransferase
MPWGFCTWAYVSDEVDERLRSRVPLIAPHEWRSGTRAWLVDVVAPFGDADGIAQEAIAQFGPQRSVRAWLPDGLGKTVLRQFVPGQRPRDDAAA